MKASERDIKVPVNMKVPVFINRCTEFLETNFALLDLITVYCEVIIP